jgi:serine/threonine protein phosphatase PrpC
VYDSHCFPFSVLGFVFSLNQGVVILIFSRSRTLVIGDVGDSTALLIKKQSQSFESQPLLSFTSLCLTVSHNVSDNSEERKRIQVKFKNITEIEDGYLRPKDEDLKFHRLAMTRALGTFSNLCFFLTQNIFYLIQTLLIYSL